MYEKVELDYDFVQKILTQLINSDGMEVTNTYLIKQKIYYIDNVALVEELEKIIMEHNYNHILKRKGQVTSNELLNIFTPKYINYDKFFSELDQKYNSANDKKEIDSTTLNKYFNIK